MLRLTLVCVVGGLLILFGIGAVVDNAECSACPPTLAVVGGCGNPNCGCVNCTCVNYQCNTAAVQSYGSVGTSYAVAVPVTTYSTVQTFSSAGSYGGWNAGFGSAGGVSGWSRPPIFPRWAARRAVIFQGRYAALGGCM